MKTTARCSCASYRPRALRTRCVLLRLLFSRSRPVRSRCPFSSLKRIASIASLHRTILELQSAALAAQSHAMASLATPSATPPLRSPPSHYRTQPYDHDRPRHPPQQQHSPRLVHAHTGGSPPQLHHHSRSSSYHNAAANGYPTLPPISSMGGGGDPAMTYGEPPRKRSRPSPPSTTSAAATASSAPPNRPSPEYPLSPYSAETSHHSRDRRPSVSGASAGYVNGWSSSGQANGRGRMGVSSLLGTGAEDDGDVKYRRMSAERSSR